MILAWRVLLGLGSVPAAAVYLPSPPDARIAALPIRCRAGGSGLQPNLDFPMPGQRQTASGGCGRRLWAAGLLTTPVLILLSGSGRTCSCSPDASTAHPSPLRRILSLISLPASTMTRSPCSWPLRGRRGPGYVAGIARCTSSARRLQNARFANDGGLLS